MGSRTLKSQTKILLLSTLGASLLLMLALLVRLLFIAHYQVPQNGMYPAVPAGSTVSIRKRAYPNASWVKRGDIIVFKLKEQDRDNLHLWRVIGLPRDTVRVYGEMLFINGQAIPHRRIGQQGRMVLVRETLDDTEFDVAYDSSARTSLSDTTVVVPPGHFFVLGDNRRNARDSRFFGPIPFEAIVGKKF